MKIYDTKYMRKWGGVLMISDIIAVALLSLLTGVDLAMIWSGQAPVGLWYFGKMASILFLVAFGMLIFDGSVKAAKQQPK